MRTPIKTYYNAEREKFILYKHNNKKAVYIVEIIKLRALFHSLKS